jgi:hypothetical protein
MQTLLDRALDLLLFVMAILATLEIGRWWDQTGRPATISFFRSFWRKPPE